MIRHASGESGRRTPPRVIPNYLTIKQWGWLNNFPALTVPFLATGFGTFLLRQFFKAIPVEIHDAATMDGCGHLRFLWTIVVPLARPALWTLGVYSFLAGLEHVPLAAPGR